MIIVREPKTKEEFNSYYTLRWNLLRKPWNQLRGSEKDDLENKSFHFIAVFKNKIVGVGRLHKNNPREGQIRFMAVDPNYQNKGIGKAILSKIHEKAKELKLKKIILNARNNSVGFYEKLGYKRIAKAHTLFGEIEHFKMAYTL